jgi:nitrate reductase alpha subunit
MAMGHVILKEFHLDNPSDYFLNYCRRYTDMPMLVLLDEQEDGRRDVCCAPRTLSTGWGSQ